MPYRPASRGRVGVNCTDALRTMHYSPLPSSHYHPRKVRANHRAPSRVLIVTALLFFIWQATTLYSKPSTTTRFVHRVAEFSNRRPKLFTLPQADRVQVLKVPAVWNRYDLPWFHPKINMPKKLRSANYRITYAPTKTSMSDGLGHSLTALNYELLVALRLGIAYSHRRSTYSSLTAENRDAVESFFGWGDGHIPREDIRAECEPSAGEWPEDTPDDDRKCAVCSTSTTNQGRWKMEHIVNVPLKIAHSCSSRHGGNMLCAQATLEFLAANNESHTIFQLPEELCHNPTSDSDMNLSKGFFFAHYWRRHAKHGAFARRRLVSHRRLTLREDVLNIAVHVRRGDFLSPAVRAKRGVLADSTFAAVLADIFALIGANGGVFAEMPIMVHIFSEGGIMADRAYSTHATETQTKQYFDSNGVPRDAEWWMELLRGASAREGVGVQDGPKPEVEVKMHISEDTLTSLHEMIAADVFVGSRSGLSNQLVWSLSRGINVVPMSSSNGIELGKLGKVCCSVPFDHDTGVFDVKRFARYWEAYTIANGKSAGRAFKGVLAENNPSKVEAEGEE